LNSATFRIAVAGSDVSYSCESADTLLRSGLRGGIGLSYECNAGSCGTCKIEVLEGEVEDLWPQAPGLSEKDRQRGRRLACQSVPQSDCTIKSRLADQYIARHAPTRQWARLTDVRSVTHDIGEFTFKTEGAALFQCGQYAMVRLPGTRGPRAYSMSNTSNSDGVWKFMIRRTPTGAVSNALFQLPVDSHIELDGPYGLAYLREESPRDIVCVAGGSGIAPMVSILDGARDTDSLRKVGAWLFYGGRGPSDVPAIDTILASHHLEIGLEWHPVISVPALAEGGNWGGEVGFVHDMLPHKLPKPLHEYEFYFAGPPPMIEATVRLLVVGHKVPMTQLHYDRFF